VTVAVPRPKPKTRSLGHPRVRLIPGVKPRLLARAIPIRASDDSFNHPKLVAKGGPTKYQRAKGDARHLSIGLVRLVQFKVCNDQNGQIARTPCPQQRQLESSCRDYKLPCCHRRLVVPARYKRVRNTLIWERYSCRYSPVFLARSFVFGYRFWSIIIIRLSSWWEDATGRRNVVPCRVVRCVRRLRSDNTQLLQPHSIGTAHSLTFHNGRH
jgi:hypothetical protein